MRINKFIAANSHYSRRKVDELIEEGKVFVNGKRVAKLGDMIDPSKDKIKVGSTYINIMETKVYIALHKPRGVISTRSDERGRKTVMDLVPRIKNIKPVGRLDKDTEGLLLLSNDGDFIFTLTHPKSECEKEYKVITKEPLTYENQTKLEKGVRVDRQLTHPANIKIIRSDETSTTLTITIHEGRNRQIRKMFETVDCPVKYLQRIRIGNLKLGSLKPGAYRYINNPNTIC